MYEQNIDYNNTVIGKSHKYYLYNRLEMLQFVPYKAKRILEVGCGGGNFGNILKINKKAEVWGVDINRTVAKDAARKLDRVIIADFENDVLDLPEAYFDCIIFNDVLEHFKYPWAVLHKIKSYLIDAGCVVASIPNVRYYKNVKDLLLNKKWEYAQEGILDITHLRFFTKKSILNMFKSCGYQIVAIEGINGGRFPWKLRLLNCMTMKAIEDMRFIEFACIAQKN